MGIIIGIDVGISTTKIVGLKEGRITAPTRITAADPITSLYGAFGKYLHDNDIALQEVEQVMLTGVGSAYVKGPVYGLPTNKCDGDDMRHIGGIGVGGGTLAGLSRLLLNTSDIKAVSALAMQGDIKNVDLLIGDISAEPLPNLPMDATASILAKAQTDAAKEDVAAGIISMVLQTIGSAAWLSSRGSDIRDFVLIGNLTLLPQCKDVFPPLEKLYNIRYHIPKYSQYCTAIGAALSFKK